MRELALQALEIIRLKWNRDVRIRGKFREPAIQLRHKLRRLLPVGIG